VQQARATDVGDNTFDIFDAVFGAAKTPETPPSAEPATLTATDANAKLRRNIDLALDRQGEILSQPVTPETPPKDKRIVAEVANHTVKTGVRVEESRLRARNEDIMPRILAALAREKQKLGDGLTSEERARLEKLDLKNEAPPR
jgi:hypothetical protein